MASELELHTFVSVLLNKFCQYSSRKILNRDHPLRELIQKRAIPLLVKDLSAFGFDIEEDKQVQFDFLFNLLMELKIPYFGEKMKVKFKIKTERICRFQGVAKRIASNLVSKIREEEENLVFKKVLKPSDFSRGSVYVPKKQHSSVLEGALEVIDPHGEHLIVEVVRRKDTEYEELYLHGDYHSRYLLPYGEAGDVLEIRREDGIYKILLLKKMEKSWNAWWEKSGFYAADASSSKPPYKIVSIVLRCKMSAIQGAIYDWIKSTNTIRVDPEDELRRCQKNPNYTAKTYKLLNNRCMELRKTCNHPLLNYPYFDDSSKDFLVRSCGKLWILDRILLKLHKSGHRVLLFSTMTRLLDIMEEYLQWRRLVYRRIDGTTSLEDRELAIVDFNRPESDCFIFLLSIRAAGRGLNLQSADTVVIYDPDPNPKNEEQAVARAHHIGQKREVKVIYLEAVVDKISSHQKEDELRTGGEVDLEDDLSGKDRYVGSIESLIRNNIQEYKIDRADEVINAGRFDQRTTHEERRMTLETLLHDEERYQETLHDVPSLHEVNRMIARSEEEVELFDQMDEEMDWIDEMTRYDQVPDWLRASSREVNATVSKLSKKPKKPLAGDVKPTEMISDIKDRKRVPSKAPKYSELDDENEDLYEASSEEKTADEEEEGEIEEEETSGAVDVTPPLSKNRLREKSLVSDSGYEYPRAAEVPRNNDLFEDAGSSGSSSGGRRVAPIVSPSISSQKFGSLSALEAKPGSVSKRQVSPTEGDCSCGEEFAPVTVREASPLEESPTVEVAQFFSFFCDDVYPFLYEDWSELSDVDDD